MCELKYGSCETSSIDKLSHAKVTRDKSTLVSGACAAAHIVHYSSRSRLCIRLLRWWRQRGATLQAGGDVPWQCFKHIKRKMQPIKCRYGVEKKIRTWNRLMPFAAVPNQVPAATLLPCGVSTELDIVVIGHRNAVKHSVAHKVSRD